MKLFAQNKIKKGCQLCASNPFWICVNIQVVPGAGIEPARDIISRDFKSLASTYSAIRAFLSGTTVEKKLEAPSGFEPEMEVLQTSALPLGDGAKKNQLLELISVKIKRNGAGNGI